MSISDFPPALAAVFAVLAFIGHYWCLTIARVFWRREPGQTLRSLLPFRIMAAAFLGFALGFILLATAYGVAALAPLVLAS